MGYYIFNRKYGNGIGSIALIAFWMTFEYVHLNWQLSWPWLTLGNVFASNPSWVMWYSFTGAAGGTLWILFVNLFINYLLLQYKNTSKGLTELNRPITGLVLIVILPLIISKFISYQKETTLSTSKQVIIVQPNIDPYEKFDPNAFNNHLDTLLGLSEKYIDSNTALILWPETALSQAVPQTDFMKSVYYYRVHAFLKKHPNLTLQTGIEDYKVYNYKATETANPMNDGMFYDAYNSGVAIKNGTEPCFYNKSKLVPGVETLPAFLRFMAPLFEKFGGTTGGYGMDGVSKVFDIKGTGIRTAPIICYESVYGEFVSSYVNKGANLLTIMTNDGWWKNTPGHKQHLQYARLRAIENNCWVIRSANTGISAVIDNQGNILESKQWGVADAIKINIPVRSFTQTFYTRHGDYLFFFASVLSYLLLLFHLINLAIAFLKRNQNK